MSLTSKMFDLLKYCVFKINRWHFVILILVIAEAGWIPAGQTGFKCKDPSLSHPYLGDTVTWKTLLVITVVLPLIMIIIVEGIYHRKEYEIPRENSWILIWYQEYMFGLFVNLAIVTCLKILIGAPRPHFFETCRPIEANTCKDKEYVTEYKCTTDHWLFYSSQSFPSGHTSMGFHAAVFIIWYMHRRVIPSDEERILPLVQSLLLTAATACAMTRLLDRRHHLLDVVAGIAIALPITYYTIIVLCRDFSTKKVSKKMPKDQTTRASGKDTLETNARN